MTTENIHYNLLAVIEEVRIPFLIDSSVISFNVVIMLKQELKISSVNAIQQNCC